MTARRYRAFLPRQDIRSVTTAESLRGRNFISHIGDALWELHFHAATTVQFRTNVNAKNFHSACCRAAARYIVLEWGAYARRYTVYRGNCDEIVKSKTTTTRRFFANFASLGKFWYWLMTSIDFLLQYFVSFTTNLTNLPKILVRDCYARTIYQYFTIR